MATLADLLADPNASISLVAAVGYLSSANVESVEWVSQRGWTDPQDGPVAAYIPPLLESGLEISQHLDPLNPQEAFGTLSQITLVNDLDDPTYRGRYDGWQRNSIDNRLTYVYAVGVLSDGTRVELADVAATPLVTLRGVEVADVDEQHATLTVRDDSHALDQALQPVTYSPPALAFPGDTTGCVDFGNHYDQTGSFSAAGWVYLEDPTAAFQYPITKATGTAGYSLDVGNGLILTVPAQSPASTSVAVGTLHARFWHWISISVDTSAHTREIGVDGASVVLTSSVTGSPTASGGAATFRWGNRLRGKLHAWRGYNAARSVAAMWAEARQPVNPAASNLAWYLPSDEGLGTTIHDRKSGSSITGTIGAGIAWDVATWHLSGILGNYRPFVLGTVPRVPVSWIDTVQQVGEVSYGGAALVSEVQSNHNALGAIWSPNPTAGTFQVTSGALSGTYSATVTANNFWNSAVQVGATTTILGSPTSPTGSASLCVQFTPSATQTGGIYIIDWFSTFLSGLTLFQSPGSFGLRYAAGAGNRLEGFAVADSNVPYLCTTSFYLQEGRTYSLAVVRNTSNNTLTVSVDGEQIGSTSIAGGTFTATLTTFGVGCRGDVPANSQALGRYDEPLAFSRALSQDDIRALHVLPATGAEANLTYAWHLDDASGTSAAPFAGASSLTLTNATWVGGRSSAADLGRKLFYLAGFTSADLDTATWRNCLNWCPADCGWYVGQGETALVVARLILGGLGFVTFKVASVIHVRRFVGLTSIPEVSYTSRIDVQASAIVAAPHDPPVWQWQILYAHNNTQLSASNIAGALASSDPDRYQYGQVTDLSITRGDYSIKQLASGAPGRFPSAVPKSRQTALLNKRDATDEATRLLALHRDSSDAKTLPMWLLAGSGTFMQEVSFDITACEMDQSDFVIVGVDVRDEQVSVTVWRPAAQTYVVSVRETDEGSERTTDDGSLRTADS